MKKAAAAATLLLIAPLTTGLNFTAKLTDQSGATLNAEQKLVKNGETVATGSEIDTELQQGLYNLTQQAEGLNTTIIDLNVSQDLNFTPFIAENRPEKFHADLTPVYYVNDSIEFREAWITTSKQKRLDTVIQCSSWDNGCGEESYTDASTVETVFTDGNWSFRVTSFSGYQAGNSSAQPVIRNVSIYRDSDGSRTGGTLQGSGLNQEFSVLEGVHRFEFELENNGTADWNLSEALTHEGLLKDWNVSDIFVESSGTFYEGGNVSSGVLTWDPGLSLGPGASATAAYVVNLTSGESSMRFNASASDARDSDSHFLEVQPYGGLESTLEDPGDGSIVQNNRNFTVNGTVECVDGYCGEVSTVLRRNSSTGMVEAYGEELEVVSHDECGELGSGENCSVDWTVNATGSDDTDLEIDFTASSNLSEVSTRDSGDHRITIEDILMVDLDWSETDFGLLDPGEENVSAQRNQQGYNVTIPEESNTVDNLWIKASELVNDQNSNYTIPAENLSYSNNTVETETRLKPSYQLMGEGLAPGTVRNLAFWLDVPYGILNGRYSGKITFKVNETA